VTVVDTINSARPRAERDQRRLDAGGNRELAERKIQPKHDAGAEEQEERAVHEASGF
jgi:hypothetical protein